MTLVPKNSGFTLVEILISIGILAMMVVMISTTSKSSFRSEKRAEERGMLYQNARVCIDQMVKDISMAFIAPAGAMTGKTKDGVNVETAFAGEENSLNLDTLSHTRIVRDAKESEEAEVGYYLENDPEDSDVKILFRREDTVIDNDVTKGGKAYGIAYGVDEFKLGYYDTESREWKSEWKSNEIDKKNRLPRAVKIDLTLVNKANKERKYYFSTIAFIEMWQYPLEF